MQVSLLLLPVLFSACVAPAAKSRPAPNEDTQKSEGSEKQSSKEKGEEKEKKEEREEKKILNGQNEETKVGDTELKCDKLFVAAVSGANFRTGPNLGATVEFACPATSFVAKKGFESGWVKTSISGTEGWISQRLLTCTQPSGSIIECAKPKASQNEESFLLKKYKGTRCDNSKVCGDFETRLRDLCLTSGGGTSTCCAKGNTKWSDGFFLDLARLAEKGKFGAQSCSSPTLEVVGRYALDSSTRRSRLELFSDGTFVFFTWRHGSPATSQLSAGTYSLAASGFVTLTPLYDGSSNEPTACGFRAGADQTFEVSSGGLKKKTGQGSELFTEVSETLTQKSLQMAGYVPPCQSMENQGYPRGFK